jgi:hypothetical protein
MLLKGSPSEVDVSRRRKISGFAFFTAVEYSKHIDASLADNSITVRTLDTADTASIFVGLRFEGSTANYLASGRGLGILNRRGKLHEAEMAQLSRGANVAPFKPSISR